MEKFNEGVPTLASSLEKFKSVSLNYRQCIEKGLELPCSVTRILKISAALLAFISPDQVQAQVFSQSTSPETRTAEYAGENYKGGWGLSSFMYSSKENWIKVQKAGGEREYGRLSYNLTATKTNIKEVSILLEDAIKKKDSTLIEELRLEMAYLQDERDRIQLQLISSTVDEEQWVSDSLRYHHMTIFGENVKNWMMQRYGSDEYKIRMKKLGLSKIDLETRIDRLANLDYEITTDNNQEVLDMDDDGDLGYYHLGIQGIAVKTREIQDSTRVKSTFAEEYTHGATHGENLLSKVEIDLLTSTFQPFKGYSDRFNKYLSDPTERHAKLDALRYYLATATPSKYVLQYGEQISLEHIQWLRNKANEFINNDFLSDVPGNVLDFVVTTPNDSNLIKLFNTLP